MKKYMTIEKIRLANLQLLVDEAGKISAVASACGVSAAYLSQILTCSKMASGKVREVGSKLARKLEQGCTKSSGWMDEIHETGDSAESELRSIFATMDENLRAQLLLLERAKLILKIHKK